MKLWSPGAHKTDHFLVIWAIRYSARKFLRHGVVQTQECADIVETIQHPWHCFSNCDPHTVPLISNGNVSVIEIVCQVSAVLVVSPFPVIYISLDESIGHGSKQINILDPRDMKCIKWNTRLTAILNVKLGNVEFHSGPALKLSRLFTNKITWNNESTVMNDWTKQGNTVHSPIALPVNLGLQIRRKERDWKICLFCRMLKPAVCLRFYWDRRRV